MDIIEKYIDIKGASFEVVGVLRNDDIFSASEINTIYTPITAYRREINRDQEYNAFCLSLSKNTDSKSFENELRGYIAYQSQFDESDKQAVYIVNFETQTSQFESLFKGLRIFIWALGICFLISGIVGICNIMFVSVKERTNEIGIRLAVGASPQSIINLVLLESVILTSVSGIIGLLFGKGGLIIIDWLLSSAKDKMILEKTSLDFTVAVMALIVLIIAGIIAGMIPAINAARIEPVDAVRYENRN